MSVAGVIKTGSAAGKLTLEYDEGFFALQLVTFAKRDAIGAANRR